MNVRRALEGDLGIDEAHVAAFGLTGDRSCMQGGGAGGRPPPTRRSLDGTFAMLSE